MWAEDDFTSFSDASLQSYSEPKDWRTYVMYHGTSQDGARLIQKHGFKQSDGGMLGRGVYVSRDYNKASRYPLKYPEREKRVLKLRVNVGRVKKIDRQGHPMQKTWHHHGYDSAWVPPNCGMVKSGLEEDCIWDPDRITVTEVILPDKYMQPTYCCVKMSNIELQYKPKGYKFLLPHTQRCSRRQFKSSRFVPYPIRSAARPYYK